MIPAMAVPILNRPDLLERLLASIDHPVGDLLIIDNGDVVRRRPANRYVERVHLIKSPTNLGVPVSWNLSVKMLMPRVPWMMIVNSDAYFPRGSLVALEAVARHDALVLSGASPAWACFMVGDQMVDKVSWDEGIFPAYFEDDLYMRDCTYHGIPIVHTGIPVHHDNSSTINSDPVLRAKNDRTFQANAAYYRDKVHRGDFTPGQWSLATRRALSWD